MKIDNQGSKPTGVIGIVIGYLMNLIHTGFYKKYLKDEIIDNSFILDIGCGGGKLIKYLSCKNQNGKNFGIDHSDKMIKLSKKINKKEIKRGLVKIKSASVNDIPFEDNKFDLVTAFETIQFWNEIDKSLSEIVRILKKNGRFLIINRYPEAGSKWSKIIILKNKDDYREKLESAGFKNIKIDLETKKGWIIVESKI